MKITVAAPPEGGRANEAVVETIAAWLGVHRGQVALIGGQRGRRKIVQVVGVDRSRVLASLRG